MKAHAVRVHEQFLQRAIRCLIAPFFLGRQAAALGVDDVHAECSGPQCHFPPDFSQADDAELLSIKCPKAADPGPIAVGRMRALVGRRRVAGGAQLLDADEAAGLGDFARQRKHECQRVFGRGDVGAASESQDLDARALAGCEIDAGRDRAVFLDDPESFSRRRDLARADGECFDHDALRAGQACEQRRFIFGEPDFGGIKPPESGAETLAPAGEVRQIAGHKMGERRQSRSGGRGVENDLDEP